MQSHAAAVKALTPELRSKEMHVMKTVVSDLPDDQREMVMGMMTKLGMMG